MAINVKDMVNTISLKGVVSSYKIDTRESKMFWDDERSGLKKGDAATQYNGYISVQTKENQFATINIQRNQSFYNGELDATSKALEAMSKQEVETFGKTKDFSKTPTIRIYGGARLNDNYYVKDGEVHGGIRAELGFGYVTLGDPVENPEFENILNLAVYVKDVLPETDKNDEETGRAVLKAVFPYTYGSEKKGNLVIRATNIDLVAGVCEDEEGSYDLGTDLLDYSDEVIDYSYLLIGELNGYIEETKTQQADTGERRRGFGKRAVIDTKPKRYSEFLLTGLDMIGDGDKFSEEDIKDAIQAREKDIAEKKREEEAKAQNKQEEEARKGRGSFGAGRGAATPTTETSTPGGRPAGRPGRGSRNF